MHRPARKGREGGSVQLQSPAVSRHLLTRYKATTADVELQLSGLELAVKE